MSKNDPSDETVLHLHDVSDALSGATVALTAAKIAGVEVNDANKHFGRLKLAKGVVETGTTVAATGAAVASATAIGAAATSGAGITSALAGAGSIIGGGMALGPSALAAGPTFLGAMAINKTFYEANLTDSKCEATAKSAAKIGTNIGGVVGIAGTGAALVSGGASGAAIMSTLATVGGTLGGGAIIGTAVFALAPVGIAGSIGYGVYRLAGGGKRKPKKLASKSNPGSQLASMNAELIKHSKTFDTPERRALMANIKEVAQKARLSKKSKTKRSNLKSE